MFYDRFAELCAEKGVKPGRACTEMGVSRGLAAKWKATGAEQPSAKVLEKMSAYFGKSINEILSGEKGTAGSGPEDAQIAEEDIRAAFFRGADPTLTEEEMDALWDDARSYMQYKLSQRNQKKYHGN